MLKGDAEGFCDSFDIEIKIDSEEDPDAIQQLIQLARKMCFTEKALHGSVPIHVKQVINSQASIEAS